LPRGAVRVAPDPVRSTSCCCDFLGYPSSIVAPRSMATTEVYAPSVLPVPTGTVLGAPPAPAPSEAPSS